MCYSFNSLWAALLNEFLLPLPSGLSHASVRFSVYVTFRYVNFRSPSDATELQLPLTRSDSSSAKGPLGATSSARGDTHTSFNSGSESVTLNFESNPNRGRPEKVDEGPFPPFNTPLSHKSSVGNFYRSISGRKDEEESLSYLSMGSCLFIYLSAERHGL